MNRAVISIALLLPLLSGCGRHRDQRSAQANRERPAVSETQAPARSVSPRPSPFAELRPPEVQPAPLYEPAATTSEPPSPPAPRRTENSSSTEEGRRVVKLFVAASPNPSHDRVPLPPPPPTVAAGSPKPVWSVIPAPKACCVGTATFEAARPALVHRMLGRVPGLRRIHQTPDSTDGYVAPRPVREISLVLPPETRTALARGTMDLKATVDESGHVTRVQLLSPKDEELVRLASYAAGAWPFIPAKVNDRAVPGEVILHFKFNGN